MGRPTTVAPRKWDERAVRFRIQQRVAEALAEERAAIAAQARLYASYYPQSSDGRNTFTILAEWVEARNSVKSPSNPKQPNPSVGE